jgi:outer membrane cobalamin receptor
MKKLLLAFAVTVLGLSVYSQSYFIGIVIDADTKEPLIGATIYNPSNKTGATTDIDGKFKLAGSNTSLLSVSFMGYQTQDVSFTANTEKAVAMKSETVTIKGAEIISDIAVARKTPVAVSTISPIVIEERLGTQEFPEILKSTPGVYATKMGGGFGDSRINLRGFESANVAVMINGVPMNDMEWGGIYWSNWAGLSDVTSQMQVQRGLGASKVSAPSVGGSINIVTKSIDAVKGGTIAYTVANDGYNKISFSVSTGLMDNGWAITLLGAKLWGDGYILGTNFSGYSYFGNISKQIGKNHILSLTAFGAPQTHYQRSSYDKLKIGDWEQMTKKYRYNATYGVDANGKQHSTAYNYFHKPQISLNHYWNISEKSTLSTALYASIARGGGYAAEGASSGEVNKNDLYGVNSGILNTKFRTVDNYYDYGALMAYNYAHPNGSQAFARTSTNEHNWFGILSTYNNKIDENWDISAGIDGRYYEGNHQAFIADIMGGQFVIDPYRLNVLPENSTVNNKTNNDWVYEHLKEGDPIYRDNTSYVGQIGLFGQAEYSWKGLSAFISGGVNNNTYWKVDRYYYDKEHGKSEVTNFWGGNIKGGANYNINKYFNVFGNTGYISRAPFMSGGVYVNLTTSNIVNKNAKNEKVISCELGAGYKSKYANVNLNAYYTEWNDKTSVTAIDSRDLSKGTVNLTGVNARHMGIELELIARPVKDLEITGMFSLGDWVWTNNPSGYAYNNQMQAVDAAGNVVEAGSENHFQITRYTKGVHVGNSAQMTAALGASYKFFNAFKIGVNANYYDRNYANYSTSATTFSEPWKIPYAISLDAFASYNFKIGPFNASINATVNNLLNERYVTDADDGGSHDWDTATVFYAFGRTASLTLKIKF